MDNYTETFVFTCVDTDGITTMKALEAPDGANLKALAEMFKEFLQGSGFSYITEVEIKSKTISYTSEYM